MKKNFYEFPKSSFLGIAKDTSLIIERILQNKNVLKLLYYTQVDWEAQPDLTPEQIKSLFADKRIWNIPKMQVDKEKGSYLRIAFDTFVPNGENTFYRNSIIELRIICHFDDWDLTNFELRPYRIAGEIDSMLDQTHLSGIGELQFIGADPDIYDDEFGGVTLKYLAIRGNEDKQDPLD